jgi:hypothetical protein
MRISLITDDSTDIKRNQPCADLPLWPSGLRYVPPLGHSALLHLSVKHHTDPLSSRNEFLNLRIRYDPWRSYAHETSVTTCNFQPFKWCWQFTVKTGIHQGGKRPRKRRYFSCGGERLLRQISQKWIVLSVQHATKTEVRWRVTYYGVGVPMRNDAHTKGFARFSLTRIHDTCPRNEITVTHVFNLLCWHSWKESWLSKYLLIYSLTY